MGDTPKLDPEREALIQEMLRDAQKTNLSGDFEANPVIHRGDSDVPAPMVVNKITNAGYVFVWDSRTYRKAPVLYYMLPQVLRQRREDGSYRWTITDPGKEPKHGTFKCLLHRDEPNRKHYDELGFRTCKKENITNPHQVTLHMKSKHKAEWAGIEEERKERERQEDRKLQQMMVETITGKQVPIVVKEATSIVTDSLVCPTCKANFTNKTVFGKHIKDCK